MLLRKDDPWTREISIPDIRNWPVFDREGRSLGFVESVVVDRSSGEVSAIFTGANERHVFADIQIGEHLVTVNAGPAPAAHSAPRPHQGGSFLKAYRKHFNEAYGPHERYQFGDLLPAYRFGRKKALDADFSGLSFESGLEDLHGYWAASGMGPDFETALPAIRMGYESMKSQSEYKMSGLEREDQMILTPARNGGGGEIRRAGKLMRTGKPRKRD